MKQQAHNVLPPPEEDCRIARRRELSLGVKFEQEAKVQENLFVGPAM